jgi:hypothetical protein
MRVSFLALRRVETLLRRSTATREKKNEALILAYLGDVFVIRAIALSGAEASSVRNYGNR